MKKFRIFVEFILIPLVLIFVFYNYCDTAKKGIESSGSEKKTLLKSKVDLICNYLEQLTVYANRYILLNDTEISELYAYLRYDPVSNSYNLDSIEGTGYEKLAGSLTGLGPIPDDEIGRKEILLALSLNYFFGQFYAKYPEIAWIYYTSENNFINIFPWAPSEDFRFAPKLKTVPFYTVVAPENNPLREALWTPVYLDEAGKGLMVTLSSPVYSGNTFLGVISVDFTSSYLGEIISGEYNGYIIDNNFAVVATNKTYIPEAMSDLNDFLSVSPENMLKLKAAEHDKVARIGRYFIYKAAIENAPWDLLFVQPVFMVYLNAFLKTTPILLIGIILIFTFREAESRRKAEAIVRDISTTDSLTGLKNIRYLDSIIEMEIAQSERYGQPLSIVSMDLDHFKSVNDRWGHPVGDDVLKYISNTIKTIIRKADIFVRLGGEEFTILLPQTDKTGAYEVAEKIRKALEEGGHHIAGKVTASLGVAEKEPGENYTSLYRRVDKALYAAKERGRNRVEVYDKGDDHPPRPTAA